MTTTSCRRYPRGLGLSLHHSLGVGVGVAALALALTEPPAHARTDEILSDGVVVATIGTEPIDHSAAEVILWTGERFPGNLATLVERAVAEEEARSPVPDETILWRHDSLGIMALPFEWIKSVRFSPERAAPSPDHALATAAGDEPPTMDLVVLANGDQVKGIVSQVDHSIVVELEGDPSARRMFEVASVLSVHFVGTPASPGWPRYWLRDGTVVDEAAPGAAAKAWQRQLDRVVLRQGGAVTALLDASRVACLSDVVQGHTALPGVLPPASAPASGSASTRAPQVRPTAGKDVRPVPLGSMTMYADAPARIEAEMPFGHGVLSVRVVATSPRANGSVAIIQSGAVIAEVDLVGVGARSGGVRGSVAATGAGAAGGADPRRGILLEATLTRGPFTIECREGVDGPLGDRLELREGLLIDATTAAASDATSSQPRLTGRRTKPPTG